MSVRELFHDEDAVRAGLEDEIAAAESGSAIRRFADGEAWEDIRESLMTGRRYEPVTWL